MIKIATVALILVAGIGTASFAGTRPPPASPAAKAARAATAYAQARPRPTRARTRITVTPRSRYPYRTNSTLYPPSYDIEYPGPGAVRQCEAKLVQEYRPSGTVIVPTTRCWWERG